MFKNLTPSFSDDRGTILDVDTFGINFDAVTLITFTAGAIRAEHYHKQTIQLNYVISGSLTYKSRIDFNSEVQTINLKAGDLVISQIGHHHAFKAVDDVVLLCLTSGPRKGFNYEKDTYRLKNAHRLFGEN